MSNDLIFQIRENDDGVCEYLDKDGIPLNDEQTERVDKAIKNISSLELNYFCRQE